MPDLDADFFYENAGWSYDPTIETSLEGRRRNAESLARAWALVSPEVDFQWRGDGEAHWGESDPPDSCEGCLLIADDYEASLWCIDDADENYRRVIEAELARDYLSWAMERGES